MDRAEQVAGDIEQSAGKSWTTGTTLTSLAEALVEAGQLDSAERVAAKIPDAESRARAFADLARTLRRANLVDRAVWAADEAERATADITRETSRAMMLVNLTCTLVGAGFLDRAERVARDSEHIANTLAEPRDKAAYLVRRAEALTLLAQAMNDAGQPDGAEKAASSAKEAAANAVRAGRPDASTKHAVTQSNDEGIGLLARTLIDLDQLDEAVRAAHAITDPEYAGDLFREICAKFAAAGKFEKAEDASQSVGSRDLEKLSYTLLDLTTQLAAAGKFDWAERVAQTIPVPFHQAGALGKIIASLISVDALEYADRIAQAAQQTTEKIVDPQHQSGALIELIRNCERKDPQGWIHAAFRLCGLILTRSYYWPDVLPLMCKLDLSSLVTTINVLGPGNGT